MMSRLRAQIGELLVLADWIAIPSGMTDRLGLLRSAVRPLASSAADMAARKDQGSVS